MPRGIYLRTEFHRKAISKGLMGHKCTFSARGKHNPNWKGGKIINREGYVMIYQPSYPFAIGQKYVFEHRLVMEQHLGRKLTSKEVVHHINGIKTDNRHENLRLFRSNGAHRKEEFDNGTQYRFNREDIEKGIQKRRKYPNDKGEYLCSICKRWLPKSSFFKKKNVLCGIHSACKSCRYQKYTKPYRISKKMKVIQIGKRYTSDFNE